MQTKPLTETQKLVAQWQAGRPAFSGPVTREPMPGKQSRKAAKAQLVKRASQS